MFSIKHKLCDMNPDAGMAGELRQQRRLERKAQAAKRIVEASADMSKCCDKMIQNNNDMKRLLKR
ncbi:MAG: hypothetical protein VX154_01950 [Pseudomonadota bacterium]|nr:hypothetical protein [Pseudomonadota bacterium]